MTGRITDWHAMEGKTIRGIVQHPAGERGREVSVVIVFDDDTWATLNNDGGIAGGYYCISNDATLTDILHPEELFSAHLVNESQRDYLLTQQADKLRAEKMAERDRLLAEAAKLQEEIGG